MKIYFLYVLSLILSGHSFAQNFCLLIGTYTRTTDSKGIYVYRFDSETGKLDSVSCIPAVNPSYLSVSPNGKYVYACTETKMETEGNVSAYRFDHASGTLKFLNKEPSGGRNPVYISVHPNHQWLAVVNYTDPVLGIFSIRENGKLNKSDNFIRYNGGSIDTIRQSGSHLHAAIFSPDTSRLVLSNLGADKIISGNFYSKEKKPFSEYQSEEYISLPGTGPRHITFHPNGKFLYALGELSGTVSLFYFQGDKFPVQTINLHHDTTSGPFASSDIHISPDGLFLYAANRGNENNLAVFSIDQVTGKLSSQGFQSTLGSNPRNFIIDPTGKYLLVANQESSTIVVFKRDPLTGLLMDTGIWAHVPSPSCLQIIK